MNIAIIGTGLIGRKRANTLPKGVNLSTICDIDEKRAAEFAKDFNCEIETNWRKVVRNPKIEALIVSTINKFLSSIAIEAIKQGKHVLVEKPGARNLKELKKVAKAYKKKTVVMFGFNHRYHLSIAMAKKIIDSKKYGEILFIRAKYGHGGRAGYEKEWRFNKALSGGGELLDQGTHLIDLVNLLCGEMTEVIGLTGNLFWKSKLEDSAFFILRNKKGQIAQLSATCVEWKNLFCFEVMMQTAKIQIDGLGGSYGKEKLTLYKMKPEMGPPKMQEFLFNEKDTSWQDETKVFFDRISKKIYSEKDIKDASYVLSIVEKLYKQSLVTHVTKQSFSANKRSSL